ncbi:GTPase activating protein, partial [Teratosphaeriaceae sp. CCFEE 6253]
MAAAPPSPPSPTASFYDLSDASETEYSTVRPRKSSSSGKGVKLLYAKSKVFVHPTASAKDNVAGWIALLQQKPTQHRRTSSSASGGGGTRNTGSSNLLLAWFPDSSLRGEVGESYKKVEQSGTPPQQACLVPAPPTSTSPSSLGSTAFAVPLDVIFSILSRPPNVGWWFGSLVINSRSGDAFPALFFHDEVSKLKRDVDGGAWGGDDIIRWLKNFVHVERSSHEPSMYLIEPTDSDKVGFGSGGDKPSADKIKNVLEGKDKDAPSPAGSKGKETGDPVIAALKQARWSFLEKMSQVTTFTRRTAQAVSDNRNLPPQVQRLMRSPQVQTVSDDFDSARLYLARWVMGIAEQSERERSTRIWTAKEVAELEETGVGEFELLSVSGTSDARKAVNLKEWQSFFNSATGRLERTADEVKERVFHGGLDADDGVRKEAWLFLLGVYEWDSTREQRHKKIMELRDEYVRLKGAWWERMVDEQGTLEEREWWKEQKMRIEKDVHRTDRHIPLFAGEDIPHPDPDSPFAESGTNVHLEQMKDMLLTYNEYNRDLGYVQGMSDLLAPIYAVEQDDAIAFWGFTQFMERMERNFLRDQSGMRLQLTTLDQLCQLLDPELYQHLEKLDSTNFFFFFRMLLVWYKREFSFPDILRLYEGLWTDYLSANFHLFVAMAILEKHRSVILEHLRGFDEVLKYVNELSGTIDLESTLVGAEKLFRRFQRTVEAIDRKSNFPAAPTLRQRVPLPVPTSPGADGKPRRFSQAAADAAPARPVSSGKGRVTGTAGSAS